MSICVQFSRKEYADRHRRLTRKWPLPRLLGGDRDLLMVRFLSSLFQILVSDPTRALTAGVGSLVPTFSNDTSQPVSASSKTKQTLKTVHPQLPTHRQLNPPRPSRINRSPARATHPKPTTPRSVAPSSPTPTPSLSAITQRTTTHARTRLHQSHPSPRP